MKCIHDRWEPACSICKPIHTARDQAWHFNHPSLGRIDSKGEFDRKCREKGLVRVCQDDLTTNGNPTKPSMPKVDKNVIGEMVRELKPQSRNPEFVEKKWRETQERVANPISPVGVEMVKGV